MPAQPPRFRPPGARSAKPWAHASPGLDKRKRGRAGQRERRQVLSEEPFCRLCLAHGRHVAADVVDHIRPLRMGGSDDRTNKQALCKPCHDAKSAGERAEERRARPD